MADAQITNIKLTLTSNVKEKDVKAVDDLITVLDKFNGFELNDGVSSSIKAITKSLSSLNGLKLNASLGKGIESLTSSINGIVEIQDITPYADNLSKGFSVLARAAKEFENIEVKIPVGLGKAIGNLVETNNSITQMKDISGYSENMNKSFKALSEASKEFEGNSAKIPVGLGRGISGIVDAANKITQVKDLTPYATRLEANFAILSRATRHFENLNRTDYTGISRLVTSLTNVGKIKPIGDTVVKNAEQLAKAIKILDANTNMSTDKLNAMSNVTRSLGIEMNKTSKSTNRFGGSLGALNLTATIFLVRQLGRGIMNLSRHAYGAVDAFGDVQNTLSFFTESLGDQADQTARIIQNYADMGAIDFTQFADQVSTLNQVYKGYGISAENASKMALNMTQLAYDASYALGQNGKDIEKWFNTMNSVATGQTRSGYKLGVDTRITTLMEEFDELTSKSDQATRSMAVYNAIIDNTQAIQGQLAREFGNTYVQMQVFQNRLKQLTQSIGAALIPVFEWAIKTALVTLKVIEMVIDSIFRLFGKEFKLINYADMINDMTSSTGGLSDAATDVGKGFDKANKAAKALKKTITGIDQVFTIDDSKPLDSNAGGIGGIGGIPGGDIGGYDWLEDLASQENLLALADIEKRAEDIFKTMQDMLPVALTLAAAFATWKLVNFVGSLIESVNRLNEISGILGGLGSIAIGVTLVLVGLAAFKKGLEGLFKGDLSWMNIGLTLGGAIMTGLGLAFTANGVLKILATAFPQSAIGKFAQSIGSNMGSFIQIGIGLGLTIGGIALIVAGIKDVFENGVNWKNVGLIIGGAISVGIGVAMAASTIKKVITGADKTGRVAKTVGEVLSDSTSIGKASTTFKMPNWTSIAKTFTIIAGGVALIVGTIWLLGKIDTSKLARSVDNTKLIGTAFTNILIPLGVVLGASVAIGTLLNKHIIKWTDIAIGMAAIDVGIVNMIAMVTLASLWKTSMLKKGESNLKIVGSAFKAIEIPLNLLLIKAAAIGAIITASLGLGALSLAAGIVAIDVAIVNMLAMTNAASKWNTSNLQKGKNNIELASKAFATMNEPLGELLEMVDKIGKNMTGFAWITGSSYDFDKALGKLKDTMDSLLKWIGQYASWDTKRLSSGGKAIDLAGKAGSTITTTLKPLLEMVEGIGKNTNNIFGLGDYDYDKALGSLKGIMDSLLKWIGQYASWQTDRLRSGGVAIELAGKYGKTLTSTLKPLIEILDSVGGNTKGLLGLRGYNYDEALKTLKGVMDDTIKWVGSYSAWEGDGMNRLRLGAEVIGVASTPIDAINNAFTDLLPLLDSIGKKTNNFLGIGNYDYGGAMEIITDSLKSIVKAASDLGVNTKLENVNKGIQVIDKAKYIINNLGGFTSQKTSGLANAAKGFVTFADELAKGFKALEKIKTNNVANIMKALSSLDLNKFKGMGSDIVKSMELGMTNYNFNLKSIHSKIQSGLKMNVTKQGQDIARDVVSGINSSSVNLSSFKSKITSGLKLSTRSIGSTIARDVVSGINSSSVNLSSFKSKITSGLKLSTRSIGSTIARDVVSGINSSSVNLSSFKSKITSGLKLSTRSIGSTIGRDVVTGINGTSVSLGTFKSKIRSGLSTSTYSIGTNIARGVQNGINGFYPNVTTFTNRLKRGMRVSFEVRSPSRWARDIIGLNIAKGVEVGVNNTPVSFTPFRNEVLQGLSGMTDDLDVTPRIHMPEIDTSRVNGDIRDIASNIDTKVVGTMEIDNDKTERAIAMMTYKVEQKLDEVRVAVRDGRDIYMDGEKVTKKVTQRQVSSEVNNNIIFE